MSCCWFFEDRMLIVNLFLFLSVCVCRSNYYYFLAVGYSSLSSHEHSLGRLFVFLLLHLKDRMLNVKFSFYALFD